MIWIYLSCLCLTMLDEFLVNVIALPNYFGKQTKPKQQHDESRNLKQLL